VNDGHFPEIDVCYALTVVSEANQYNRAAFNVLVLIGLNLSRRAIPEVD
jgi:hypothetical protein